MTLVICLIVLVYFVILDRLVGAVCLFDYVDV